MKLIINNKIFICRYDENDRIQIQLNDDFDKLFFKKWESEAFREGGSINLPTEYKRDIDFIKSTERGFLRGFLSGCFPILSKNEDFVIINYDLYTVVS
jgi:hypothetical protein